ncbi:MAG: hypothetical protein JNM14_12035 [Ferruginibacter sp.]|nr:hypothetical protein [Ferruginibacter sp.]
MKYLITLISLLSLSNFSFSQSQKRVLTQNELNHYFKMCNLFKETLPKSFQNYAVQFKDCNDPNAFNLETNGKGGYNTAVIGNNQAAGFLPTYDISFSNPNTDNLYKNLEANFDYTKYMNNTDSINCQEARLIKTISCKTLKMVLTYNTGYSNLSEAYDASTTPEQLVIPNASFANLYKMPYSKPIIEEDGTAQHHSDVDEWYTDRAVITFGVKPTIRTVKGLEKQSYNIQYVTISDDGKLILLDKIRQISVFIYGSERDIKEIIKIIDWNKVYTLIGK